MDGDALDRVGLGPVSPRDGGTERGRVGDFRASDHHSPFFFVMSLCKVRGIFLSRLFARPRGGHLWGYVACLCQVEIEYGT